MKYYLYRHIRLDNNLVFYIGIGTQRRNLNYERSYNFKKRSRRWLSIYKHTNIEVEIIMESDDMEFIKQKEIEFIKLYGKKENSETLVNYTDGGDGLSGFKVNEETKEKLRILNSGKNHPQYGTKATLLTRKKQSKVKIGIRNVLSKPVICINNNKTYESCGEAALDVYGKRELSKKISDIINNRRKTYKGYSFKKLQ